MPIRASERWLSAVVAGILLLAAGCRPGLPAEIAAGSDVDLTEVVLELAPEEGERLAREIRASVAAEVHSGLELSVWAAGPLVADPVAMSVDRFGRVHITRTMRTGSAEFDIRSHRDWMTESLTWRTVEDRRAFLHRELAPERSAENTWLADANGDRSHDWRDLTVDREHVYRLEDTNGNGIADRATRIIAGFNTEVSDVAVGLHAHEDGDIFVGIAPDLWRFRDTSGDGVLDSHESISHGYGVHIGFSGHGQSGVTMGPDGRLYWGIGDIGMNVTDRDGRRWEYPHQGVIVRSELDGSGFEVFAAGLRNTHEFVFDEFGNLISVDNDGDHSGERERVVYLVDGSDSGWRINWQFGKYTDPDNNAYKVWMDEGLWRPRFEGQAAYILPPIASYHAGPAGMVYNPGTALSPEWRNHFFVSAFTGNTATTRIHAFQLAPLGAGFELSRDTVVVRGILTTGLDFGPDGSLYLADWITGWGPNDEGRIWKLDTPEAAGSPIRRETEGLLRADLRERPESELGELLRHADMRVRSRAQFALAERGALEVLLAAARQTEHQLARVHGIWGVGQLARRDLTRAASLQELLGDADPEIRAQAAKVLGDVRYTAAGSALLPLLRDPAHRARFFAAEALGRIEYRPAVQPVIEMLAANDDRDVYLRHAGSLALARIGDADALVAQTAHPQRAVRIASVIALRRMKHPGVGRFLADADEYVVTEAARAINDDESIPEALPALARILEQERFSGEALIRRAINANHQLATPEAAARLASYAARTGVAEPLRLEAVAALGVLPRPSILDRVDGTARNLAPGDPAVARAALEPMIAGLLGEATASLRAAAADAAGRVSLQSAAPLLRERLNTDRDADVRIAALRALHAMEAEPLEPAIRTALADDEASVRMAAVALMPSLALPEATVVELLVSLVGRATIAEQQSAVQTLGGLRHPTAERALGGLVEQLEAGGLPPEIHLELFEAVESSRSDVLIARLAVHREARYGTGTTALFAEALHGGSRMRGQQIVARNESAQCLRCHTLTDQASTVGPDLRGIGARLSRERILEALVDPNASVAAGYVAGASAMPSMQNLLSRREIRDVVEYLSTLR